MKIKKDKNLFLIPGFAAYIFLLVATLLWAYWGVGEVFHEGWYPTYTHIIFYFIPFLVVTMVFFFPVGTIIGAILWKRFNHALSKKYLNYED